MQDELLDLVDENDNVIGEVWMSKAHKNPKLIHREVAVVVFTKKGEVLLQQRSMNTDVQPGIWTLTAAGHVPKGEDPMEAIKRETKEELGLTIEPKYFGKAFKTLGNLQARFVWLYYVILDKKPPLALEKKEVNDAKWIKVSDLEKFSKTHDYTLTSPSHEFITQAYEKIRK